MDEQLSDQFDRVEKALSSLVDSIAAYNPSPQAAVDLVAADDELSHGLDQLARHQANHGRLQSLRAEADALEEQLKASVSSLASLRHELFETPATRFPDDSRPVRFDELLQYAKNISQHTVPPTYRERVPNAAAHKDNERDDAVSGGALTNGLNTPANVPDAMDVDKITPEPPKDDDNQDSGPQEITVEEEEWLKKLNDSKIAWYPWPSDDKVRAGNLYKLMYWQTKNKDLDEFNIYAHEEAMRLKESSAGVIEEAPVDVPVMQTQGQQAPVSTRPTQIPTQNRETFDAFDDLDDD